MISLLSIKEAPPGAIGWGLKIRSCLDRCSDWKLNFTCKFPFPATSCASAVLSAIAAPWETEAEKRVDMPGVQRQVITMAAPDDLAVGLAHHSKYGHLRRGAGFVRNDGPAAYRQIFCAGAAVPCSSYA